jgi:hypothetical protein
MFTEKDFDEFESAMAAQKRAEARHLSSEATLRRGGCVALVLLGVGGLILLGGEGFSLATGSMYAAQESEKTVAAILAQNREQNRDDLRDMLATTTIPTRVTVSGEVGMKDGIVRLDPNSQLVRVSEQASEAAPDDAVPTWQSVYKVLKFGSGEVQSYASFRTSTAQKPFRRKCIYFEDVGEGLWRGVLLESNGQRIAPPNPSPFPAVDLNTAAALCVQLTNLPVQAVAPVAPVAPVQTILIHAPKR